MAVFGINNKLIGYKAKQKNEAFLEFQFLQ